MKKKKGRRARKTGKVGVKARPPVGLCSILSIVSGTRNVPLPDDTLYLLDKRLDDMTRHELMMSVAFLTQLLEYLGANVPEQLLRKLGLKGEEADAGAAVEK